MTEGDFVSYGNNADPPVVGSIAAFIFSGLKDDIPRRDWPRRLADDDPTVSPRSA